jgi:hypothetical protein
MLKFDRIRFIGILRSGLLKGWHGFVWILKILVPISFLTVLLAYSGWLDRVDFILAPAMNLLHLPAMAAFPLVVGLLTGIYGGIAAMVALPFTPEQMTLLAIFLLISHNLFQESIIQSRSGLNGWTATFVRLAASVFALVLTAPFLHVAPATAPLPLAAAVSGRGFFTLVQVWVAQTTRLSIKIFFIIMALMLLLELMRGYDLIRHLRLVMNPLMRLMGLDRQVGFLWLTAAVFGLTYGGAVIVQEVKAGHIGANEIKRLQLSIGINHSVIEDPVLFLPLGVGPLWLWIPRLLTAIIFVRVYTLVRKLKPAAPDTHPRLGPSEFDS